MVDNILVANRDGWEENSQCDVCGVQKMGQEWPAHRMVPDSDPDNGAYYTCSTHVTLFAGDDYPGVARYGRRWSLNVCPQCFLERILPLARQPKDPELAPP
jgi:hypothetical protein